MVVKKAQWDGRASMNQEALLKIWENVIATVTSTDEPEPSEGMAAAALAERVEFYLGQVLLFCPVGSRISLNIQPGVIVSCIKNSTRQPFTMRWLVTD